MFKLSKVKNSHVKMTEKVHGYPKVNDLTWT